MSTPAQHPEYTARRALESRAAETGRQASTAPLLRTEERPSDRSALVPAPDEDNRRYGHTTARMNSRGHPGEKGDAGRFAQVVLREQALTGC